MEAGPRPPAPSSDGSGVRGRRAALDDCPVLTGFDPLAIDFEPFLARARDELPVFYSPEHELWCVTRHADVDAVYRDPITFSNVASHSMSVPIPAALAADLGPGYVFPHAGQLDVIDPPQHTRVRRLLQKAFTPKRVGAYEGEVNAIADALLDRCVGSGETDLMSAFTTPLPIAVIAHVLGIPPAQAGAFHRWTEAFFRLSSGATELPEDEALERWSELLACERYLRDFIDQRRQEPTEDLTSDLVRLTDAGGDSSLTEDELLANIIGFVTAGSDTSSILMAHAVYLLLTHPDDWEAVKADPSLVPNAVEETLRIMGSVRGLRRTTTTAVTLGGARIPKGARVYIHLASANRDRGVFEDPDRYDLARRDVRKHLGFGVGAHFCIGASLARLEARVALERLIARVPNLRLAEQQQTLEYLPGMVAPLLRGLRVEWS